ncbi:MAG: choice-of-anchor tandem repeat GloVer-containing protein, partial [Terriglobales bacterium]
AYGGSGGVGTVFELSPSGGGWTEQVIYEVGEVGLNASTGLAKDAAGNIFGVGEQTVFELSPNGHGGWNPTVIHTFTGAPKDGSFPYGTPALDKAGSLYGTTYEGGTKNYGAVYRFSPEKTGKWTEKILYSFKSGKDGNGPQAGIVFDAVGNIYGTTTAGGKYKYECDPYGCGTVYELVAPVGKGSYKEKVLWRFDGTDGFLPQASLILDKVDNLYGTTLQGGSGSFCPVGCGVVFEVAP